MINVTVRYVVTVMYLLVTVIMMSRDVDRSTYMHILVSVIETESTVVKLLLYPTLYTLVLFCHRLFPIRESGINFHAQELQLHEIEVQGMFYTEFYSSCTVFIYWAVLCP